MTQLLEEPKLDNNISIVVAMGCCVLSFLQLYHPKGKREQSKQRNVTVIIWLYNVISIKIITRKDCLYIFYLIF